MKNTTVSCDRCGKEIGPQNASFIVQEPCLIYKSTDTLMLVEFHKPACIKLDICDPCKMDILKKFVATYNPQEQE